MHAFLLINTNPEDLAKDQKAKIIPYILQRIEDTRNLKKITKFSFSQKTAIVIKNIDQASEEALNALLKNIEEPSENLIYILTATNINNVIPTIVSRCQVIAVPSTKRLRKDINYKDALDIKDREEAIKFVEDLIFTDKDFINKENYLKILKNLKANGNVSLQLTNLLVKINGHG